MVTEPCSTKDILPLFKEYMSHMSQFFEIEDFKDWLNIGLGYLGSYETDTDRYIFALKHSSALIGFAMVNSHLRFNKSGFAIAEFYVDMQHRSMGCGRVLAIDIFSQFPGQWEVAVTRGNEDALTFWGRVISDYTDGDYRKWNTDSYDGTGFTFSRAKRCR